MTKLKFILADEQTVSFADFYNAIDFCESEFGFDGEEWNEVKDTVDQVVLRDYLIENEIDVELIHEYI
ncbi:hypothetical protein D1872_229250 [compost metagenome]